MTQEGRVTIKIPRPLYEKITEVIKGSGFSSVTDFIVYVLRDVMSAKDAEKGTNRFTKEEIELVRQRLKSLGYF